MTPSSALAGITVLEICNVAAGPFCGMLLADMGADVIKVENPDGGDTLQLAADLRRLQRELRLAQSQQALRDLESERPGDLELARELALTVDVLIENNRPGVMDRLGLGYEALKARNPRLVYCSISAYGQSGPRAQEGGFDLTIQAMSGIMSVTGEAGGEPSNAACRWRTSAGLYGAFAIASALRAAQASGQGAHIDVPMLGATLGIAALQTSEFFGSGRDPVSSAPPIRATRPTRRSAARAGTSAWPPATRRCGRACARWLAAMTCWPTPVSPTPACAPATRTRCARSWKPSSPATRPRPGWRAFARRASPARRSTPIRKCWPIRRSSTWAGAAAGTANGVRTRTFGLPVRFDGQTTALRRRPPALGEHNEEVLGARARRSRHERHHGNGRPAGRAARRAASADAGTARQDERTVGRAGRGADRGGGPGAGRAGARHRVPGRGPQFQRGFDFGDWESQSEGDLLLRFVRIEMLLQRVAATPCLTVALAHGRNFGAGVDLFGACKWRLAAPRPASACRD